MTAQELFARTEAGEPVTIIDTRAPAQYEKAHVEGAISIPLSELRAAIESLDKDAVTVTYCNKGVTGNAAQNILLLNGFKHVYNLSGGMNQYRMVKNSHKR